MLRKFAEAWKKFVRLGSSFFNTNWRLVPFQPILFFVLWCVTIRIVISDKYEPIHFEALGGLAYGTWAVIGMVAPVMVLISWFLIYKKEGKPRVVGMILRTGGDTAMLMAVLAFHLADMFETGPFTEADIYERYIVASVLLFLLFIVIRDLWSLHINEKKAKNISRFRDRDGFRRQ